MAVWVPSEAAAAAAVNTDTRDSNASNIPVMSASGQERRKRRHKSRTTGNSFCCGVALKGDKEREPRCSTPPPILSAVDLMIKRQWQGASPNIRKFIYEAFNDRLNPERGSRRKGSSCLLDRVLERNLPHPQPLMPKRAEVKQIVEPLITDARMFHWKLEGARRIARDGSRVNRKVRTGVGVADRESTVRVSRATNKTVDREARKVAPEKNKEAGANRQGRTRKIEQHYPRPYKPEDSDSAERSTCDMRPNAGSAAIRRDASPAPMLPQMCAVKCADDQPSKIPYAPSGPRPSGIRAPPVGTRRLEQPVKNNKSGSETRTEVELKRQSQMKQAKKPKPPAIGKPTTYRWVRTATLNATPEATSSSDLRRKPTDIAALRHLPILPDKPLRPLNNHQDKGQNKFSRVNHRNDSDYYANCLSEFEHRMNRLTDGSHRSKNPYKK